MTPTEQDNELREQIHKLFGDDQADDGGYQSCYDGKWIDMTNEVCAVADFITADRKRVELEARIDELEHWRNSVHENTGDRGGSAIKAFNTAVRYFRENIDIRIVELKQELEKL